MPQDNKALARRWFDEVWNNRNKAVIHELAHPDVVTYGLGEGGAPGGVDQLIPFIDRFIDSFPDIQIVVDDVIADGDQTAVRLHATGTHTGGAMGVPPTGRRVNVSGIIWMRWKDGRIIEGWNEFDAYGMTRQLTAPEAPDGGAPPAPPQQLRIKQ